MATSGIVLDLRLQDPGADGGYLLEALLEATASAERGGAIFAWTNHSGATLFLGDATFREFAERGSFDLVVGTDSITDERALETLIGVAHELPTVSIRAFVHEERVLFHPKLSWFGRGSRLRLVIGSGNLTVGGTRGNWEAFAVADLAGEEARTVEQQLHGWLVSWSEQLLQLEDPRVLDRVRRNTGRERDLKRLRKLPAPEPETPAADHEVLIAEIPKAGTRWSQANFDQKNYEEFFGAKVGSQRRISLVPVAGDGSLGEIESRPSVEVKSHNYRFELATAKGLSYPAAGRPTAVFVRLPSGIFLYRLLMPGDDEHAAVAAFLDASAGSTSRMRRVRTTVAALRSAWPDSPLWMATDADQ